MAMQLNMQIGAEEKEPQDLDAIGLGDVSFLECLSRFDPYGAWRLDIETGLTYWSRDVFLIHGMEPQDGPVDVFTAVSAYHPDDRPMVAQCVEEAVKNKSCYRFVLRIKTNGNDYKMVKSTGAFRSVNGKDELYGTFSEFQLPVRSVALKD